MLKQSNKIVIQTYHVRGPQIFRQLLLPN